ncbi:hypothetical protein RhiirA4_417661 [Rhizophagus irregularis]|uniref:Uncharacterized protein n=1 Tax=Rhizophagus irregularis TaxID=588596 RepID=A0A2I1G7R8_9GLOM|nr:hypothetical protein RhiirA4_417661 [Rhizophagus irregularis]
MIINSHVLASKVDQILSILKYIIKDDENDSSLIDYPVLIGSTAAKWHHPSFREPKDWNLVATISQSILFINNVNSSSTTFKNIKLIYYQGSGLKINGEFTNKNESSIIFDIELVSDKVDLRKLKFEIKEKNYEESDEKLEYNKIKFENFDSDQPKPSSLMILELCHDVKDKKPLNFLSNFSCIVAPLKILEALKTSHIYCPTDFSKNIGDLHLLRIFLGYNSISKTKPLCSPQRDETIELMLKTRIKESEIIRRLPAAYINLNMTEDLEHEDNSLVQEYIPHYNIHELVKYGDHPIYESLDNDESKAWIKKSFFEKIDYQARLNCIKEEAMTIALERYLIPMFSNNQETSYNLALARICTTLTKGWFRQFAVDNYSQLTNLDKDLSSIANNIINKFSLKQVKEPIFNDPETQAIFKSIHPYTKEISSFDKLKFIHDDYNYVRSGIKITSPVNNDMSITAIVTTTRCVPKLTSWSDWSQVANWIASVVILPSNELDISENDDESNNDSDDNSEEIFDPLNLHPHYNIVKEQFSKLTSKHVFVLHVSDIADWERDYSLCIKAKSADWFAHQLDIPNFNGDILFKYVLEYLNPTLEIKVDKIIKRYIKLHTKGLIPNEPQHLWYSVWDYALKNETTTLGNYEDDMYD